MVQSTELASALPSKKHIILGILTILIFIAGYSLAPEPLDPGEYDVTINYDGEADIQVNFQILIDGDTNSAFQSANQSDGDYMMSVLYYPEYSSTVNSKILFKIRLYYQNTTVDISDIVNFDGEMVRGDRTVDISATSVEGKEVIFDFRVLRHTNLALGLLLAISFLWLTELVPLAASSLLIPVIIVYFDIDSATGSLSQFANPIIFLFLAGFLLAEAMKRSELDHYISISILSKIPSNGKLILLSLMLLCAGFSMFMSNTAAAAVLIPLAIQLIDELELQDNSYKRTVVLGIAYSATIGGIGSLIGTPPNIIATEFLRQYDVSLDISFAEWFLFGLPIVLIMIPITFFHLWYRFKPNVDNEKLKSAKQISIEKMKKSSTLSVDQWIVSVIFVIIFVLWLTTEIHGISASIIAIFGAVLLYFTGQIQEEDLNNINWNALITFGGGLTLGDTILRTGLADWIAMRFNLIHNFPVLIIIFFIGIIALLLTAIASNTASAAILIPILIPISVILEINPIVIAVFVAIVCSVDFAIVIGTPPTMVAYSTNLFSVREIFKTGIILDVIGLIITTLITYLLFTQLVLWL